MPKGDGQLGKRRGRYKQRPISPEIPDNPRVATREDLAWMQRLISKSKLDDDSKTPIAEACLGIRLALRDLRSGRPLTAEEIGKPGTLAAKLAQMLKALGLAEEVDDDSGDEDEDDGE